MDIFGQRLKRIREQRGWTPKTLARFANIPYETIHRVEKGTHAAPRIDVMRTLAIALGVSLDYLAGLTDDPLPKKRLEEPRTEDVSEHEPADVAMAGT